MRCLIWSILGQGASAAFGFLLLAMAARASGIDAAGALSLQLAVGSMLYSIAVFGAPSFHRTDIRREYAFGDYLAARILMVGIIGACALLLAVGQGFRQPSGLWILAFFLTDALSDSFRGESFRQGCETRSFQAQCLQYLLALLAFAIVLHQMKSLDTACFALAVSGFVLVAWQTWMQRNKLKQLVQKNILRRAGRLMGHCAPLLISALVTLLQVHSAKYILAWCADDAAQGYLSILMMPMSFMNLLGSMLSAPYARRMSLPQPENTYKWTFLCCGGLMTLSILSAVFALKLLAVLSAVYGVSLMSMRRELTLLLLGGGFMACCAFSELRLIAARRQKWCLITNLSALCSLLLTVLMRRDMTPLASVCLGIFCGQGVRLLLQYTILHTKRNCA